MIRRSDTPACHAITFATILKAKRKSAGGNSDLFEAPPVSQQERRASAQFARIQARHTMGQGRDPVEGSVAGSLLDTLVRLLT